MLWIAKEGLKAPLPEPWKPCRTPKGEIYYFNFQTNESIWEHPCDQYYKKVCQEEKLKKAQRHVQSQMELQGIGQHRGLPGAAHPRFVQLPSKVGSKVAAESNKLDKEYGMKVEKYRKEKKDEIAKCKNMIASLKDSKEDLEKILEEYKTEVRAEFTSREVS